MHKILAPTTPLRPTGHAHVADLDACLDFINSESYDDDVTREHLPTAEAGVAYFALRNLAHEDLLRAQVARDGEAAWLDRIHATRAAMRAVWDAQVERVSPDERALDILNGVLREAPRVELVPADDCCGVGHRHTADDPTGEALAMVLQPLVDAIATGGVDRFRICANDGCRWVFEDTSRAGRRRWCDMSSCGNRAKVRRYRSRHRDEADAQEAGPTPAGSPPVASA